MLCSYISVEAQMILKKRDAAQKLEAKETSEQETELSR